MPTHSRPDQDAGERPLLPTIPPVLYGGSVNPRNAAELIAQPHVDGLFIGRSAWQPEGYIDILSRVSRAIERT